MRATKEEPDISSQPPAPAPAPGKSKKGLVLGLAAVAALAIGAVYNCNKEAKIEDQSTQSAGSSNPEKTENTGKINLPRIATQMEALVNNLDEENKTRLLKVIALLKNPAELEVRTEKLPPNKRATASKMGIQGQSGKSIITVNEDFNINNIGDVTVLIHELYHIVDENEARANLSFEDWAKVYGAHDAVEIRNELKAWELQLLVFNQLTKGIPEKLYQELKTASDLATAEALSTKYTDLIMSELKIQPEHKAMIKDLLETYYAYRSYEKFGLDCKWSANFAVHIASRYTLAGIKVYEIDIPKSAMGKFPGECFYPLPPNGPYTAYRVFVDNGKGMAMPTPEATPFEVKK